MKTRIVMLLVLIASVQAIAQQTIVVDSFKLRSIWEKKFFLGFTLDNCLVTIKGTNMPQEYFWKPAIGMTLKTEYYFHKNVGITIGVGYQQKGGGIISPDNVSYTQNLGDPDSTHRARIKFNVIQVPVALVLRSNQLVKGLRLQASFGIIPTKIASAKYVFMSIEDGFHKIEMQSERYYKSDLPLFASVGADINAGNSCVFQAHLIASWGKKNVYNPTAFPGANGTNNLVGIRLACLF